MQASIDKRSIMSGYLCDDLMLNIFKRLPVKSLVRFTSLSKSWRSRIATQDFIRMHNIESFKAPHKVLTRQFIPNENQDIFSLHSCLPFSQGHDYIGITGVDSPGCVLKIVGSCNGILCLVDSISDYWSIYLWNFSIRRKLAIPRLKVSMTSRCVVFGFGYDPINYDYKIVGIPYLEFTKNHNSYIYSMKRDSWSVITSPTTPFNYAKSRACYFNGTLHWLVSGSLMESSTIHYNYIVTFNLSTHVFGKILLPEPWFHAQQIIVYDCSLALVSIASEGTTRICEMREYGNVASWSWIYMLKPDQFNQVKDLQPVANGDIVFNSNKGTYQVYYHETWVFSKLFKFGSCDQVDMETYVESLELLGRGTPCGRAIFVLDGKGEA